ncbi:hypothetical protein [Nostoc sp.]
MPNTYLREAAPTASLRDPSLRRRYANGKLRASRYANAQYKCPMPHTSASLSTSAQSP